MAYKYLMGYLDGSPVRMLDGPNGASWALDDRNNIMPWTAADDAAVAADFSHQEKLKNPTTLAEAREGGLFGPHLRNDPRADAALAQILAARGLSEEQGVQAAISGLKAHEGKFGQGYTTASSLAGIFNDFIFPAAGVSGIDQLESIPGWTRNDANLRGQAAANREHGGDFGSATGLGQILSYQSNLGGNVLEAWKQDPERPFLGINTPFESEVWGKVTGKDYRPTVDMYGGNTSYDTQSAQEKGIDTQSGEAMHQIAKMIAGYFGGKAINGLFGEGDSVAGGSSSASMTGDAGNDTLGGNMGEDGWYFDDFSGEWVPSDSVSGGGLDMTRLDDPTYWNPEGGTTGLADPGASGLDMGTSTYGGESISDYLRQAQDLAKKFGITPALALQAILKAVGRAAPAALGVVGANQQRQSLEALANKYLDFGAPSRARYEASFAPGFTMANEPGYRDALDATTKAFLHKASVAGNPAASPNAWEQTLKDVNSTFAFPALQNFRNTNANAGGIANLQTSAPGLDANAVNAGKGVFDAIGGGINDIFNPRQSLAQQLAEYKRLLGTAA